ARGDAAALLSDRERLSYRDLACRADRYARWALRHGVVRGEVVWLLMANRPEYVALWLGITRVGGVVALANTHLVGDSLLHSLTLVAPRHVIVGAELAGAFAAIRPRLDPAIRCWIEGGDGLVPLHGAADGGAGQPFPADAVEPLVRRADGCAAGRPHVQLPAALPQRRRRRRHRRHPGRRRRRRRPRAVLGAPLLERGRRVGMHPV